MLRIVLPLPGSVVDPVTALDVRVAVEVVIHVDIDVVATPAATPTPATAPPCGTHRNTDSKGDCTRGNHSSCRIRRIVNRRIRIGRRAVNDCGIVAGHIDDLWIRLLDDDHLLVLHRLRLDLELLARLQCARALCLLAHALYRVHDVSLLRQECIAEVGSPLNVICKSLHHVGYRRHGLNARVPRLFLDGINERLIFEALVLREPLLKLNQLQRIGRGNQYLAQERIRIERYRCNERIELSGRDRRSLLSGVLRRARARNHCSRTQQ